jgi:TPR repeat protein
LQYGEGVEKDPISPSGYFRLTAARGNSDAQFRLAVLYTVGIEMSSDVVKAREYVIKAADHNHSRAQ